MSIEEALTHVGSGPFQWLILAACGLANAADAVEILSVGLLGTAAEDDLDLTPQRAGALNACIFIGMFLGGLAWGLLADVIGRRAALALALGLNGGFGLLSAASTGLGSLLALRLLAGVGVGGSMPVVFALMSECCSPDSRGKFMAAVASSWMLGSLYSASMGWLIIPAAGWRVFVAVASLPALVACGLMLALVPESPRFLAVMGRGREAAQVLIRAGRMNGRPLPPDFTLPSFHHHDQDILSHPHAALAHHDSALAPLAQKPAARGGGGRGPRLACARAWAATVAAAERAWGVLSTLLSPPLRSYTLPLALAWVGLCGGWYCTVLWLPRYFESRGARGQSIYGQTFAVALANLPGNIASLFLIDRLGRRLTACACMAGACVCALLFAAAPAHGPWPILAACVFNGVSVGGWNALDAISAELYPTSLRASGFGLLNAIGRVASFATTWAAGALLGVALWAPLAMAAALLAAGSAAMLRLPEPAGKPLEDSFCPEDRAAEGGAGEGGCAPGPGRALLASGRSSLCSLAGAADGAACGAGGDMEAAGSDGEGAAGVGGGRRVAAEKVGLLAAAQGRS